jgi:CubicO group peptidase (beta-lactamase class C family)
LLIAKDGKVFYNKTFGFYTYAPTHPVEETDLYDIASVTKIAASTVSIMKSVDEGFIDVDKTVGDYIPSMNVTNKGQLRLRDLLAHQAGLPDGSVLHQNHIERCAPQEILPQRALRFFSASGCRKLIPCATMTPI